MKKYFFVVGLVLFAYLMSETDVRSVLLKVQQGNMLFYVFAVFLSILSLLTKSNRWRELLRASGSKISTPDAFRLSLLGNAAGTISPGRVGDFVRAAYVGENSLIKPLATVIADRLFDVFALILFLLVGGVIFILKFGGLSNIAVFFAYLAAVFALLLVLVKKRGAVKRCVVYLLQRAAKRCEVSVKAGMIYAAVRDVFGDLVCTRRATFFTALSWLLMLLSNYFLVLSLGFKSIGLLDMLYIVPAFVAAELLPVSLSGIGTRDGVLVVMFSFVSLSSAAAIAYSLLILSIQLFMTLLGVIVWAFWEISEGTKLPSIFRTNLQDGS